MKNLYKLSIGLLMVFLYSCEEVVEINLETATPRLVINAPLEWKANSDGSYQIINLSTTAGFYQSEPPKVSGAIVTVKDSQGTIFLFEEGQVAGQYECIDFQPQIYGEYELEIIYNNETYIGTETLYPVPDFDKTEQIATTFGDLIEIRAFFTDPENEQNFYLIEESSSSSIVPGYFVYNDNFFNGKQTYYSRYDENLVVQDLVTFKLFGISSRHYDYLFKLTSTIEGGPFQTVPGLLLGNVKNITNHKNFSFGYFSLSQTSTIEHIIN